MKNTFVVAIACAVTLFNPLVSANCDCNVNDSPCLMDCVTRTNKCIIDCGSDVRCYTDCILHNWPGVDKNKIGWETSPSSNDNNNNNSNNGSNEETSENENDNDDDDEDGDNDDDDEDGGSNNDDNDEPFTTTEPAITSTNAPSTTTIWDVPPPPEWDDPTPITTTTDGSAMSSTTATSTSSVETESLWPIPSIFADSIVPPDGLAPPLPTALSSPPCTALNSGQPGGPTPSVSVNIMSGSSSLAYSELLVCLAMLISVYFLY
ncbi:MAG: hypothetical protein EXX96DRAFT_582760 [Benjaminiella poitrasii]|nr:MAG: hypothetical protein EXX96DRAFT_582760 [Benjaminiella poitrasii]